MHVSLIVPAPFETISGGYGYDRRIVAGLRALGHAVDVLPLPGRFPVADQTARDAACSAWDTLPADTRPVVDGLALHAFSGMGDALAARGCIGLVHHPLSVETGLDAELVEAIRQDELLLFRRMKRVITTSQTTAELLTSGFQIDPARLSVVEPGTDIAPRSVGSGGPTCRILSVGTVVPRKGHDLLLRALARLFDLDWHLTVVGALDRDPVCAHGVLALAETLNVQQRVTFLGEVGEAELADHWAAADVFASATRFEGYGMAVAEAIRRGLPVVVTDGGAVGRLITPECGAVCPLDDLDQLSKTLRRLIFDRGLRSMMAEAAWVRGQSLPRWEDQSALFAAALA